MKKETLIKIIILVVVILIVFAIFIYKNSIKDRNVKVDNEKNNLENDVSIYSSEEKLPTLLDFGSTTCEPCQIMFPILDRIEKQYEGKVTVKFINVYTDPKIAQKYKIVTIPTQIFLDSEGKVMYRHQGVFYEDQIIQELTEMGVK